MTRLIDAESLKKAIDEAYEEYDGYDPHDLRRFAERVDDEIDNAPSVEPKKEIVPVCKVTFDKEQLQELVDKAKAEVLASIERPQGEWIKIDEEWYDYKCSICGEKVRKLYPFCHCGADMRKGGAKNDK